MHRNGDQTMSRQKRVGATARAETTARLIDAAAAEFSEHGYVGATVARIAARADVTVQTLYLAVGSKRALLRHCLSAALSADPQYPDQLVNRVDGLVGTELSDEIAVIVSEIADRAGYVWKVYRDAAATDLDIAADWYELQMLRKETLRRLLAAFPDGHRRRSENWGRVVDTVWILTSPDTYDLLVTRSGYSAGDYRDWLAGNLAAAVIT